MYVPDARLIGLRNTTLIALFALFATLFTTALTTMSIHAAGTIFVDATATGANNGSSWTDAYPNLHDALTTAVGGNEIWVAAGMYYPDVGNGVTNNDRNAIFMRKSGVAIYGGFAGTETDRSQRD